MIKKKNIFNHKPEALIFYSFVTAAFLGALLLQLPFAATTKPLSFIDALFMATSAVCVTGLSLIDIGTDLTLFGQIVILFLIQLGGLGIMTFSMLFLIFVGKKIAIAHQLCIPDLSQEISIKNFKYAIVSIVALTATIELIGAVLLYFPFRERHSGLFAMYNALFHSISSYCNAGFSLYADSFMGFSAHPYVMSVVMVLIVFGGLGFIVLYELLKVCFRKRRHENKTGISLHTKIALTGSFLFICLGAILIWCLEHRGIMQDMPLGHQIFNSLFLSITSRTAGFNTLDTSLLSNPTLLLLLLFMFVGGCPGSTAGGVKIHTFFSLIALTKNKLQGLSMVSLFKRKIPDVVIDRALTIFISSMLIVFGAVFLLQLVENVTVSHFLVQERKAFLDTLFEAVSAFGTVGLTTGTTNHLSYLGKIIIILLMFVGRIGPLTLGIALQMQQKKKLIYEFPQEEIIVS
ncbi:MAG: hypothetical protein JW938_07565 [Candidatus Omnitrophica bacterium]|nr:hypothetical protein [Candidatus Omnitrophota bacterium]